MAIKIVFLDMDGTLLNSEKELSAGDRAALERAAAGGVLIVPATGRFYTGIPDPVRRLPFVRYAVCVNGAQVYDAHLGRTLRRAEIPLDLALQVYEQLDRLPVIYDCYLDGGSYMPRVFYEQIDRFITDPYINRLIKSMRTPVEDLPAFLTRRGQSLQKIMMFFQDMDCRAQALESLPARFPALAVTTSIVNNIELNIAAANKGDALVSLCRQLGIDPAEAMAVGDSSNDLSMFRAAGLAVAMANASPDVQAQADYVTASNDDDGVAAAIQRFCFSSPQSGTPLNT